MKIFGKEFTFNGKKVYHAGDKPTPAEIGAASSTHNHQASQVTFTDGKTFQQKLDDGSLKGPKGDTGAKGATGATGPTGPKGDTGAQGPQGVKGNTGAQGPQGVKGDTGAKGNTGTSMRFKGAWSSTTAYVADANYVDIVTSGGNTYRCKSSHTNQAVTNTTYWELIAQKGANGATGAQGPKGDKGDTGATGPKGDKGATGPQGPAGAKGADGLTTSVTVGSTKYTHSNGNITIPAYPTALKNPTALTLQFNGTTNKTYDGSSAQTLNITPAAIGAAASNHTHNYAGSSSAGGNANAAVKLATARSINGTNFDGTGNITTANWGTARTLTIGNTGKSVNGSGNVSWSLSEIGAAAASHNHDNKYLSLSGGTISGSLRMDENKLTIGYAASSQSAIRTDRNVLFCSGRVAFVLGGNVYHDGANDVHYDKTSRALQLVVNSEKKYPVVRYSEKPEQGYGVANWSRYFNVLTDDENQNVVKGQDKVLGDFEDWNSYEYSGVYLVSINNENWGPNCPPSSYAWGNLLVFRNSSGIVTQMYFPHNGNHCFQFRTRWGTYDNWTNWVNPVWGWGLRSQTLELTEEDEENNISVGYIMQQLEEQKKINEELHKKINMLEDKISKI